MKIFRRTVKHRPLIRHKIRALELKEEFRRSAVFSVSMTIGINWSIFSAARLTKRHPRFSKKTVTRPRITRARRDIDIEPVERRLADARYLVLSRRHGKANRRPAQRP